MTNIYPLLDNSRASAPMETLDDDDFIYQKSRDEKFKDIVDKYEISLDFSQRLQQLQGFKIVFIFDDSGSMNAPVMDSPLNNSNSLLKATRWDELQYFAKISLEIATLFNPEGCSIYFLNKKPSPIRNVSRESELRRLFLDRPRGFTPLPSVLDQVLNDHKQSLSEQKLLILICTDGEPTDHSGNRAIPQFKQSLLNRDSSVFTTIVACTDDDSCIEYLNRWDHQIRNLDVIDDYRNERKEIRAAQGIHYQFSFGDYVVKSLIGSIDPEIDNLDKKNDLYISSFFKIIAKLFYFFLSIFSKMINAFVSFFVSPFIIVFIFFIFYFYFL